MLLLEVVIIPDFDDMCLSSLVSLGQDSPIRETSDERIFR